MADKTGPANPALTAAFDVLFRVRTAPLSPVEKAMKEIKKRQMEEELRDFKERMREKYR